MDNKQTLLSLSFRTSLGQFDPDTSDVDAHIKFPLAQVAGDVRVSASSSLRAASRLAGEAQCVRL